MRALLAAALLLALAAPAAAQHKHAAPRTAPRTDCEADDTALRCAKAATPAFAADGSLWLAWSAGGRVMVARDRGEPVAVNAAPEAVDDGGDGRPVIAVDGRRVAVAWAVRVDKAFNGRVFLASSEDGGRSFSKPAPIADNAASQRFPVLGFSGGRLYAAWIDKRVKPAALALAWSDDGGRSWGMSAVAEERSCECCRIALTFDAKGLPLLAWRHNFAPNIRDHALLRFADRDRPGKLERLAEDDWRVDACPHHGPALAVAADGSVTAAWFTQGSKRQGLFLAHAGGEPRPIGNADNAPSHPQLLAQGGTLWLAWKEFDGEQSVVRAQTSADNGASWSSPFTLAATADASDHPILAGDGKRAVLSWLTRREGWRLIPLAATP